MSLNPGIIYWMDIFSHLFVVRIVMFVWKDGNKRKTGQGCPISKNLYILPQMWPDLAKFRHFGKSLQVFVKYLMVNFLFGKMLSLLWQICDIIGLIFIFANGQILKNNISIWSHCLPPKAQKVRVLNWANLGFREGNYFS